MAARTGYQPLPQLLPRCIDIVATFVRRRAAGIAERPLGLADPVESAPLRSPTLVLPTDLLATAWRQLFPAERMMFVGGHRDGFATDATSLRDVTSDRRSLAYVKASPTLLHEALLDWEATGACVVGWIHSHPGTGLGASNPSDIDHRQDMDLRATYGPQVVGIIVTQDGWLRLWGQAITRADVTVDLLGRGVVPSEVRHVYRVAVR